MAKDIVVTYAHRPDYVLKRECCVNAIKDVEIFINKISNLPDVETRWIK